MRVALLLYGYPQGVFSSRQIAKACIERMDFAAVTGFQKPDCRTISLFRKRHLTARGGLFQQVLVLCRQAGLVALGHIALAATKIKANASKHKAMSYDRMVKRESEFAELVKGWLDQAEITDLGEDSRFRNRQGDELPAWVVNKVERMKKLRQATERAQVIVSCEVVNTSADCPQLLAMVDQVRANLGRQPDVCSADAGYCSETNLAGMATRKIRTCIATGRQKHGSEAATQAKNGKPGSLIEAMRDKLKRGGWRSPYRLRQQVVEPVFGQIKQAMGFRQFLLRGLTKVKAEWQRVCTAHNLLKRIRATA
jgi:IS5 family transposase